MIWVKNLFCLFALFMLFAFSLSAGESQDDRLGFWEIRPSEFKADEPFILQNPVPGNVGFLYVWPFTFKYTTSLNSVSDDLKKQLSAVSNRNDPKKEELLKRSIKKVDKELAADIPKLRFFISLYTETDKTYYDISSPIIRNMAEMRLGKKLYTVSEIAEGKIKKGETVNAVAIFKGVDPVADVFEITVMGIGKRIVPSYYPGHILKAGLPYNAKLRKAIKFKYLRPGDSATRAISKIKLLERKNDWVWLWANEIYPMKANDLELKRTVDTEEGDKTLLYKYKYFPYEIFNSTPESRSINITEAGIALKIKWQGMAIQLNMKEDVNLEDFRKNQAIEKLKNIEPDYFNKSSSHHVRGEIKPGKISKGIAIFKWGIRDPESIVEKIIRDIRIKSQVIDKSGSNIIKKYKEIYNQLNNEEKGFLANIKIVPDDEIKKIILEQAMADAKQKGINVSVKDKQDYGEYAYFAALLNSLSEKKLSELNDSGRMSVYFAAKIGERTDNASFERLTDIGRPKEVNIDTSISTDVAIESSTSTGGLGGFGSTTETSDDGGKKADDGGSEAVDLW